MIIVLTHIYLTGRTRTAVEWSCLYIFQLLSQITLLPYQCYNVSLRSVNSNVWKSSARDKTVTSSSSSCIIHPSCRYAPEMLQIIPPRPTHPAVKPSLLTTVMSTLSPSPVYPYPPTLLPPLLPPSICYSFINVSPSPFFYVAGNKTEPILP